MTQINRLKRVARQLYLANVFHRPFYTCKGREVSLVQKLPNLPTRRTFTLIGPLGRQIPTFTSSSLLRCKSEFVSRYPLEGSVYDLA
ncbi:hypothetical protein CA13_53850 [Planctomycetes bacterium CA13]|uniref:Uncharacterized protein n=1 Tax=Novipirellula herctigrandis TaxID=2527986 RepID=A0A5C5ZAR3_9BACT|nr:hypothetical protein CA13_53850 [Planctomycetes bacterium CA13]